LMVHLVFPFLFLYSPVKTSKDLKNPLGPLYGLLHWLNEIQNNVRS
jgi:hypothetical protein